MASDHAKPPSPSAPAPAPDWAMPEIADVAIRARPYAPREPRNFAHPLKAAAHAVAIELALKSALPIRAQAPVLWVDDQRLTEYEPTSADGTRLCFWAPDRARLKDGAALRLAWSDERPAPAPAGRARPQGGAAFRYRAPG